MANKTGPSNFYQSHKVWFQNAFANGAQRKGGALYDPHAKVAKTAWVLAQRYYGKLSQRQKDGYRNGPVGDGTANPPNIVANDRQPAAAGQAPGQGPGPAHLLPVQAAPARPRPVSAPADLAHSPNLLPPAVPPRPLPPRPAQPAPLPGFYNLDEEEAAGARAYGEFLLYIKAVAQEDLVSWRRGAELGKGAFGAASKWLRVNERGETVDVLAVKDTFLGPTPTYGIIGQQWHDERVWDASDEGKHQLPIEAAIHRDVCQDSAHIVKYRGHSVKTSARTFRLYMDLAKYGTLMKFTTCFHPRAERFYAKDLVDPGYRIELFHPQRIEPNDDGNDEGNSWRWIVRDEDDMRVDSNFLPEELRRLLERGGLPENLIWAIFAALVDAAIAMDRHKVAHRDMSWGNILVSTPPEDVEPAPIAKLSRFRINVMLTDFGYAARLNDPRFVNPRDMLQAGTIGFVAPEQHDAATHGEPLGSHTNVFSIGCSIFRLMFYRTKPGHNPGAVRCFPAHPRDINQQLHLDRDGRPHKHDPARWLRIDKLPYSQTLRDLVTECLQWESEARPKLERLRQICEREMAKEDAEAPEVSAYKWFKYLDDDFQMSGTAAEPIELS